MFSLSGALSPSRFWTCKNPGVRQLDSPNASTSGHPDVRACVFPLRRFDIRVDGGPDERLFSELGPGFGRTSKCVEVRAPNRSESGTSGIFHARPSRRSNVHISVALHRYPSDRGPDERLFFELGPRSVTRPNMQDSRRPAARKVGRLRFLTSVHPDVRACTVPSRWFDVRPLDELPSLAHGCPDLRKPTCGETRLEFRAFRRPIVRSSKVSDIWAFGMSDFRHSEDLQFQPYPSQGVKVCMFWIAEDLCGASARISVAPVPQAPGVLDVQRSGRPEGRKDEPISPRMLLPSAASGRPDTLRPALSQCRVAAK